MRGGGFLFDQKTDSNALTVIRWAVFDRQNKQIKTLSSQLKSIETATGKIFSLVPDSTKPWLKIEDGGGNCLYGKLMNYPTALNGTPIKTDPILAVTTCTNEIIQTTLALTDKPYEGKVIEVNAEGLGIFLADMLRDIMEGPAESEEPTKPINLGDWKRKKPPEAKI